MRAVVAQGEMAQHYDGVLHQYHSSLLTCGMFDWLTAETLASQDATLESGSMPTMCHAYTQRKKKAVEG